MELAGLLALVLTVLLFLISLDFIYTSRYIRSFREYVDRTTLQLTEMNQKASTLALEVGRKADWKPAPPTTPVEASCCLMDVNEINVVSDFSVPMKSRENIYFFKGKRYLLARTNDLGTYIYREHLVNN